MKMGKDRLHGVVIAIPSPLTDEEDIDVVSLKRLLDYCIDEGANGIMISGTMGEGTSLIDCQRELLVDTTVSHVNGRVPVLATASGASTRKNIEQSKVIAKYGVDYIVCTSPYYYKFPDPESVVEHVQRIIDVVDHPIIFYNAPLYTGNFLSVDTLERLLNMDGVYGVKDSSCNYNNFVELLRRYPNKEERPATIMQGDESVFDASLLMGADGVVSGGGVAFIKILAKLYEAALAGDKMSSISLQRQFSRELLAMLAPDPQRNWLYNIKKQLADRQVIDHAYVTAPFMGGA